MEESQADGIVIRFIPAVFAVVEDGDAVSVALIRQVCPLLCIWITAMILISAILGFPTIDILLFGLSGSGLE